jgi:hypothetical protein
VPWTNCQILIGVLERGDHGQPDGIGTLPGDRSELCAALAHDMRHRRIGFADTTLGDAASAIDEIRARERVHQRHDLGDLRDQDRSSSSHRAAASCRARPARR